MDGMTVCPMKGVIKGKNVKNECWHVLHNNNES